RRPNLGSGVCARHSAWRCLADKSAKRIKRRQVAALQSAGVFSRGLEHYFGQPLKWLSLCLAASTALHGADWRQFRGDHSNGVSEEAGLPTVLELANGL